ncbi:hypothetical protein KIS4809_1362 [Bacillus sp. ZZV12-4809]|nr:hypothetical protein KIS4809_1362 [Bacillus sp. ZZV12-4809]
MVVKENWHRETSHYIKWYKKGTIFPPSQNCMKKSPSLLALWTIEFSEISNYY